MQTRSLACGGASRAHLLRRYVDVPAAQSNGSSCVVMICDAIILIRSDTRAPLATLRNEVSPTSKSGDRPATKEEMAHK